MDEMTRTLLTAIAMQASDRFKNAGIYFLSMTLTAAAIALQSNKEEKFVKLLDDFVESLKSEYPQEFDAAEKYKEWLDNAGK